MESFAEAEERVQLIDIVSVQPVKKLADYAFAESDLSALVLPQEVEEIGRYAFYRCFSLKRLAVTDSLTEIGAGAFTGCRLKEIVVDFYKGERSCLKSILDENCDTMYVTLRYHRMDGRTEEARLVFPEHYEEAVENTPARLIETHYHGSGGDYRQCFYNRELNYQEYDLLLPRAAAEEQAETVAELVVNRLRYPYRLSKEARERYETWLKNYMTVAAQLYSKKEDLDTLHFFSDQNYWTKEALLSAVEAASDKHNTAILSMLLDERYRRFPHKKKVFEL